MNKILLLIVLVLMAWTSKSQITINMTDMPQPGDTIRTSSSTNITGIDYEAAGANYTWDFSSLVPVTQDVDTFISIDETPFLYRIVFQFQTDANLAQKIQSINAIPNIELKEIYQYFTNNSSRYSDEGFAFTMNGIPFPVNFSSPDVLYEFPLDFGNEYSSQAMFNLQIPGMAYMLVDRSRTNNVDGWGTIITPFGTFEALRVYSAIEEYDSIYIDSLGTGFPIIREYEEYKWLTKGMGIPVCTVTKEGLISTISYVDSVRAVQAITEPAIIEAWNVYPNPCIDQLRLSLSLCNNARVSISLYSSEGKLVAVLLDEPLASGQFNRGFNLKQYHIPGGLYFLRISAGGQIVTGKIIL